MVDPFRVVQDFEGAIGDFTGAPYVVTVNSCSAALHLCFEWWRAAYGVQNVYLPARTYPSVMWGALHAGHILHFEDYAWTGVYRIMPMELWDCAKRFTGGMYLQGQFMCVSFHPQKPFALSTGGGAILLDSEPAQHWLKRARFDGRAEGVPTKDDSYGVRGWHYYMMPPAAAEGLHKLSIYSRVKDHPDQEMDKYPDLRLATRQG